MSTPSLARTVHKLRKRKEKQKRKEAKNLRVYQQKWREKGPIWFAENVLTCVKEGTEIFNGTDFESIDSVHSSLSQNGQDTIVLQHFKRPYIGRIRNIRIKTMLPWKYPFTPNHPILAIKRRKHRGKERYLKKIPTWILAKDLAPRDILIIPKIQNNTTVLNDEFNTEDDMYFLGFYVAEGCVGSFRWRKKTQLNTPTTIFIRNYDVEKLNKIKMIARRFNAHINKKKDLVFICNTKLALLFLNWFGHRAKNKKIPSFILKAPNNLKWAFLQGFIDGDGHKEKRYGTTQLYTSSEKLAKQLYVLLWSLDKLPYITYRKREKEYNGYKWSSDEYRIHIPSKAKNYGEDKDRFYVPIESIEDEIWEGCVSNIETSDYTFSMPFVTHNCPPDVPQHPDFNLDNNPPIFCEGCEAEHPKYRENGSPYHIILSDYQKEFLYDLWKNGVTQPLVSAARGAGKTFTFTIWDCWQLATRDKHTITYMGGSSKQSKLSQSYIDDWRYDVPVLYKIINKSLKGIERYITTIWRGRMDFSACSETASRGPHVSEVDLDEVCTAESKSEEGANAVKAAMWQRTGKRISILKMASTAHFISGMFYEYMTHPDKYGFKTYQWAISKHISGKKPTEVYTDKEPSHWLPNVWWVTKKEIQKLRRAKSDEEWLCEALGGASMASGAVFKKEDLDICICSICEECEPYNWNKCPLVKALKLGTEENPTKYILEREAGFDYGVSEAPCALSILGRKGDVVFVLFNDEQIGLREEEKIDWIIDNCKKWDVWTFIPDPAVAGKHLNEKLEDKGFAVYIIPEHEKMERTFNVINHVEKHRIIIPKAFWYLTTSLRKLAWDRDGKLRKVSDHSFDSIQYGMIDYHIEEEGMDIMTEFMKIKKKPTIDEIWGIK